MVASHIFYVAQVFLYYVALVLVVLLALVLMLPLLVQVRQHFSGVLDAAHYACAKGAPSHLVAHDSSETRKNLGLLSFTLIGEWERANQFVEMARIYNIYIIPILVEMLNIIGERERPNFGFRDVRAAEAGYIECVRVKMYLEMISDKKKRVRNRACALTRRTTIPKNPLD